MSSSVKVDDPVSRPDRYFCICEEEQCWCMRMIRVENIPPEILSKIRSLREDYVLPCPECAAGRHDLTFRSDAEKVEIVRREVRAQLRRLADRDN